MNKRGQFYLVASIIIALVVFSLAGVSTYIIIKQSPRSINEVSEDLAREGFYVTEYGIYNEEDVNSLLEQFAENSLDYFSKKAGEDSNIIFVYGNADSLNALKHSRDSIGEIRIGNAQFVTDEDMIDKLPITSNIEIVDGKKIVHVSLVEDDEEQIYDFELKEGEIFYFIIITERDEEKFILKKDDEPKKGGISGAGVSKSKP
ncbi:hypothetical protein J4221_05365 [Candidatus Pacearchaeota archaeon]|nr:hypothetical protein [Candidatus Pacearchaeota archaeon]